MDDLRGNHFKSVHAIINKAERYAAAYKAHGEGEKTLIDKSVSYCYNEMIFNSAAEGKSWAMYTLAYMYENGISVKKDMKKAFFWYEKGAKLGDDNCQLELFYYYKYGKAEEVNMHLAVFWIKQSATKGNPVAQFSLARIYLDGSFEAFDYDEAHYWLTQSANSGYRDSMFYLGDLAESGALGKPNYEAAYKWYLKASGLNSTEAQIRMARLVLNKFINNEKYMKKAVTVLKKLIKTGNDEALYLLGSYYKRLGGSYYEQAFILLSEAANTHGNKAAIFEIGEMYEMGLGLPRDNAKAMEYFNKVMNLI